MHWDKSHNAGFMPHGREICKLNFIENNSNAAFWRFLRGFGYLLQISKYAFAARLLPRRGGQYAALPRYVLPPFPFAALRRRRSGGCEHTRGFIVYIPIQNRIFACRVARIFVNAKMD